MRRDRWGRLVGLVGATVLVVALLGAMVTSAGAHQGDGIVNAIHACVATRDGNVRIVGPTGACNARKEMPEHWSIQGPTGPQGPTGLQGIQGPPGVLGSFDDLQGLLCTRPGAATTSLIAVTYSTSGVAT